MIKTCASKVRVNGKLNKQAKALPNHSTLFAGETHATDHKLQSDYYTNFQSICFFIHSASDFRAAFKIKYAFN